jgi:hypothetical protein
MNTKSQNHVKENLNCSSDSIDRNSIYSLQKNRTNDLILDISKSYNVTDHSNNTVYPWYSNIEPISFWLNDHVVDGKRHLNFSEFTKLPLAVQNHKLEETVEMVEKGEMPLADYTYLGLHAAANLTQVQRQ